MFKKIAAISIGGFFGALLRYGLSEWIPHAGGFPWPIFIINLSGCLFLGWFLAFASSRLTKQPVLTIAIGTGFTGAFTTFSTFSLDTVQLIQNNHPIMAFIYVFTSVIGGLLLVYTGMQIARRMTIK